MRPDPEEGHVMRDGRCFYCLRTEEEIRLMAKMQKLYDYANGLRIWGSEANKQVATDILYLIGEK